LSNERFIEKYFLVIITNAEVKRLLDTRTVTSMKKWSLIMKNVF